MTIAWSITAREAINHPGVQRLKGAVACQGWMSSKNYLGPRVAGAGGCKNPARWHFTPMAQTFPLYGPEGVDLCFKHLVYTGVCGNMAEEQRTREWLTKLREDGS